VCSVTQWPHFKEWGPLAIAEGATWVLGSMLFYKFSINLVPYYAEEAVNYETTLIY